MLSVNLLTKLQIYLETKAVQTVGFTIVVSRQLNVFMRSHTKETLDKSRLGQLKAEQRAGGWGGRINLV